MGGDTSLRGLLLEAYIERDLGLTSDSGETEAIDTTETTVRIGQSSR